MQKEYSIMHVANRPLLIAAGGTGGHVFPAIAVAHELQKKSIPIAFVGVNGMEKAFIQKENWDYHAVAFCAPKRLTDGFKLLIAIFHAVALLKKLRPSAVLAMGGYSCVPSGIAAWLCRIPLLIHEQNAIAGRANRLLARFATHILTGFPNALPNGIHTGNPVRQVFAMSDTTVIDNATKQHEQPLQLLIIGGSQGAKKLNEILPIAVASLLRNGKKIHITHQTGKNNQDDVVRAYEEQFIEKQNYKVVSFIDNMADAMKQADLVICRAGAATLAEISIVGTAALFVPFPYAAADHQTANARFFSDQDAAILIPESQLTPEALVDTIDNLNESQLNTMRQKIKALAMPNAAKVVMKYCLESTHHAT